MRSLFPRFVGGGATARQRAARVPAHARRAPADGLFRSLVGGMGELVTAIEQRASRRIRFAARRRSTAIVDGADEEWAVDARQRQRSRRRGDPGLSRVRCRRRCCRAVDDDAARVVRGALRLDGERRARLAARARRASARAAAASSSRAAHNALRITACTWVSSKWAGRAPAGHGAAARVRRRRARSRAWISPTTS